MSLTWEVFLAPSIPAIAPDLPPGETARPWPPISSTLISGERDAVLVDAPITVEQSHALVNWLVARGQESDDNLRHAWPRRSRHIQGSITIGITIRVCR